MPCDKPRFSSSLLYFVFMTMIHTCELGVAMSTLFAVKQRAISKSKGASKISQVTTNKSTNATLLTSNQTQMTSLGKTEVSSAVTASNNSSAQEETEVESSGFASSVAENGVEDEIDP